MKRLGACFLCVLLLDLGPADASKHYSEIVLKFSHLRYRVLGEIMGAVSELDRLG
jgi:VIT1/CCC1 family predicted Fe2+/Mn2+ transporter